VESPETDDACLLSERRCDALECGRRSHRAAPQSLAAPSFRPGNERGTRRCRRGASLARIAAVAESESTARWRVEPNSAIGTGIVYGPVITGVPAIFV